MRSFLLKIRYYSANFKIGGIMISIKKIQLEEVPFEDIKIIEEHLAQNEICDGYIRTFTSSNEIIISYAEEKKAIEIIDFDIIPIERRVDLNNSDVSYLFYLVKNREKKWLLVDIDCADLSDKKWISKLNSPDFNLFSNKNSFLRLRQYVGKLLDCEYVRTVCIIPHIGWTKINERWAFVHSDGVIGHVPSNVIYKSSIANRSLLFNERIDEKTAFTKTLETIDIFSDSTTLPLLAYVLLSILYTPLKEKELAPDFVLWLYGTTGIGKTAFASLISKIYDDKHLIRIDTHKDDIRKHIKSFNDCTVIFDDYGVAETSERRKSVNQKSSDFLRSLGDASKASKNKNSGNCLPIVTAEKCMETLESAGFNGNSSNSRMLRLEADNIFRKQLNDSYSERKKDAFKYYNENKIISSSIKFFIEWLSYNINDGLLEDYLKFIDEYRSDIDTTHPRYATTYAHLRTIYRIFLDYGLSKSFINFTQFQIENDRAKQIFEEVIKNQQKVLPSEPVKLFLRKLKEMIDTREILIYVDVLGLEMKSYNENVFGVLSIKKGVIYIFWDILYKKIREKINTERLNNNQIEKLPLKKDLLKELIDLTIVRELTNEVRFDNSYSKTFRFSDGYELTRRSTPFNTTFIPNIVSSILNQNDFHNKVNNLNSTVETYSEFNEIDETSFDHHQYSDDDSSPDEDFSLTSFANSCTFIGMSSTDSNETKSKYVINTNI